MNPQTAIIDTATRIILVLTTDSNPPVTSTQTAIVLPQPITSLSGYAVLGNDNITLTRATTPQIQAAGLDPVFNAQQVQTKLQAMRTAITTLNNDATVQSSVKAAFQAFMTAYLS